MKFPPLAWWQSLLLPAVATLVVLVGWRWAPVEGFWAPLVRYGGYAWLWPVVLVWGYALWQWRQARTAALAGRWPAPRRRAAWRLAVFLGFATVWLHLHFGHESKILWDDVIQQNTALAMHRDRAVFVPTAGEMVSGVWLPADGYIDKRPHLYPWLLCLLHDLTGYRPANAFVLNFLLTPVVLGLIYSLGRRLRGAVGGALAVVLFCGLPLAGFQATSGGWDWLHLALALLVVRLVWAVLAREGPASEQAAARIALLASAVALGFARYEGVALIAVAGGALLWDHCRRGQPLPWVYALAPLALLAVVGIGVITAARGDVLYQIREFGLTEVFSAGYFAENWQAAQNFWLWPDSVRLGSPLLTLLGIIGGLVMLFRYHHPGRWTVGWAWLLTTAACALGPVLMLFYFWGQVDNLMVSRVNLPIAAMLAVGGAELLGLPSLRRRAGWVVGAVAVGGFWVYAPVATLNYAHRTNPAVAQHRAIVESVRELPDRAHAYFLTNNAAPLTALELAAGPHHPWQPQTGRPPLLLGPPGRYLAVYELQGRAPGQPWPRLPDGASAHTTSALDALGLRWVRSAAPASVVGGP